MFGVCCQTLDGANVVREARKTIKNARYEENGDEAKKVRERLDAAEKSLMDALSGEKKVVKRAELYYTAALVQCRLNDIENEKIYLKRAYDTVLYYNSIYNAYKYFEKCDSVELASDYKGRFKFRSSARKRLLEHRANLLNGGRFYLRKKSYSKNQQYVQEYLCRSHLALNDTAAWVKELKRGIVNFPDHTYFFTSLQEFLNRKGKYDDALLFADRMIQYDPKNALFWYAKALVYMRKDDYKNCIANCDVVLTLDSMNIEANYFKGLAYCNMAKASSDAMKKSELKSAAYRKYRTEMMTYYALAEEPLEQVRRLSPDKASRWAPLLYQVYLNQNKGEEFDEMERIIRDIKKPEK